MAETESKEAEQPAAPEPAGPGVPGESSLAARASCFTFIALLLVALSTWFYLWWNDLGIEWSFEGWLRVGIVIVLVIAIPIVVFRTITLWMMRERSKYPDIHFAWEAGLSALAQNGMSLYSAPVCIVIGGLNPNARRNFMHASGYQFRVDCIPDGPAPFHWYATNDVIFLVLNDSSWSHEACRLASMPRRNAPGGGGGGGGGGAVPAMARTIQPGDLQPGGGDMPAPTPAEAVPGQEEPGDAFANLRGTIVPPKLGAAPAASTPARAAPAAARVDSETSTQLLRRLQHVCSLLRNARHPVCPVNGVLALIPYEILQDSRQDVRELRKAIAGDLSVAQRELRLRCPVTAVVTGMEKERGFRELIKRVGPQRAARQRFGQRFDIHAEATAQELSNFSRHVCGTFEDWVYTMFGEKDSLSHPGNNLLFAMLCRVRRSIRTRLADVLEGFGARPDDGFFLIFSGCYFAGTGPKGERQAFVRGVLDKVQDEQEEVEWTDEAVDGEIKSYRLTQLGWGVAGLLGLGFGGLIVYSRL